MSRFIRIHWRTIRDVISVVIGILGLGGCFLTIRELDIAREQADIAQTQVGLQIDQFATQQSQIVTEQAQKPVLEYSYQLVLSESDDQVVTSASTQLVEAFYESVYQYVQTHPDSTYGNAAESALPITVTIPAQPISLVILISNIGAATADDVRVVIQLGCIPETVSTDVRRYAANGSAA
jgi:hypothetical protein